MKLHSPLKTSIKYWFTPKNMGPTPSNRVVLGGGGGRVLDSPIAVADEYHQSGEVCTIQ